MSKKRKIILVVVALIMAVAAALAAWITVIDRNKKEVYETEINGIDLAQIPDGTYVGEYSAYPVAAEVEVTVMDHAITGIDLTKHTNGKGGDAEVIPQMVVDAQSLLVDTISGATFSSKVILLAIQDALDTTAGE